MIKQRITLQTTYYEYMQAILQVSKQSGALFMSTTMLTIKINLYRRFPLVFSNFLVHITIIVTFRLA